MDALTELGLSQRIRDLYHTQQVDLSNIARVIQEHKELYVIQNAAGIFQAEITGNLRYLAESRTDFPAVGDWVEVSVFDDDQAIIHSVLPRVSLLERQSVGSYGEKQIIATNIDFAFVVQAVDRDFNLNRLERYFVIVQNSDIEPVVVLNKTDLISEIELEDIKSKITARLHPANLMTTNIFSENGMEEIKQFLHSGRTYCFLGSSGVGKSSLINLLTGNNDLKTSEISESSSKGRHTTTHREIRILENGSILIDTPGMREIGVTENTTGVEETFKEIFQLAEKCKFANCTHTDEPGCNVLDAIDNGILDEDEFENFKKLERQSVHFSATIAQKRKKDKDLGKMIKDVLKNKKKNKF